MTTVRTVDQETIVPRYHDQLAALALPAAELVRATELALRRVEKVDLSTTIVDAVARIAKEDPDRCALLDGAQQTSYAALRRQADTVADALRSAGGRPDDVVAVHGPRSAGSVAAFLGVERAGLVYLPVDETWPEHRMSDVLRRSGARFLMGPDLVVTPLPTTDGEGMPIAAAPAVDVRTEVRYVLYTSGTTGEPKGAVIEHRGMLNHLWSKVRDLGLTAHDAVAFTAPLVFDISIWQMLTPLLVGGRVVVVRDGDVRFPRRLIDALEHQDVTVVELVPTVIGSLIAELRRRPAAGRLSALRWLMTTGEEMPSRLAAEVLETLDVTLLNAYGPTECSDDVTHHIVTRKDTDERRLPIGRPVLNTALYVLSAAGTSWRACEYGEVGELFVGGLGVGRGYLGDPVRTMEVFFADPFDASSPTGRLYRTGDQVRMTADHCLEYVGRTDRQVKVSGVQMELGEIEATVGRHPGVRSCAVAVHSRAGSTDSELVAHYVPANDPPTVGALQQFLRNRLPEAMVPRRFVAMDTLPLTPNGKIDYRALAG